MKRTTNSKFLDAILDHKTEHKLSNICIDNVYINGDWMSIDFQKVDNDCFIVFRTRRQEWLSRREAIMRREPMFNETWYKVTKDEGNELYKQLLASKWTENGKVCYLLNL